MPQFTQTTSLPHETLADLLVLSYAAFLQTGWTVEYATGNSLMGYTKKTWNTPHDYILVEAGDESLTVTSKLPENASWDLFKKNKKNVTRFLAAFDEVKAGSGAGRLESWRSELHQLQLQSEQKMEEEQKQQAETDSVMKLSTGSKIVTHSLVALNVLVFVAMVVSGISVLEPSTEQLRKWGGNFKPYTTGGEWWRLLTSTFVHAGILHVLFNMYALYMVGVYLEPMLGKLRYLAAYVCSGVMASIASIWWHGDAIVSVGASGAVFGLYGVFLALLSTKIIPAKMRNALLQSIGVFVVYNLVYGAARTGVDNAAHIGGLLSGFIIGYCYYFSLTNEQRLKPALVSVALLAVTVSVSSIYVYGSKDDTLVYQQHLEQFGQIEEAALNPLRDPNNPSLLKEVSTISQPKWAEAKKVMDETAGYRLNAALKSRQKLLRQYIDLRIQQTDLIILALQGHEDVDKELDSVSLAINEKIKQIQEN